MITMVHYKSQNLMNSLIVLLIFFLRIKFVIGKLNQAKTFSLVPNSNIISMLFKDNYQI